MRLWKVGCGISLLGVLLTLGSCGLFGLALDRKLEQRQVAIRELDIEHSPISFGVDVEGHSHVRIEFDAIVLPSELDRAAAESSATIVSSRLSCQYRVLARDGSILDRGAGAMTGTEIIPEAARRETPSLGNAITLNYRTSAFEVDDPGELTIEVDLARADDDGRPLTRARATVYDRVGRNAGGLAAGGLVSLLAGPLVVGAGLILLLIGILIDQQKKRPA